MLLCCYKTLLIPVLAATLVFFLHMLSSFSWVIIIQYFLNLTYNVLVQCSVLLYYVMRYRNYICNKTRLLWHNWTKFLWCFLERDDLSISVPQKCLDSMILNCIFYNDLAVFTHGVVFFFFSLPSPFTYFLFAPSVDPPCLIHYSAFKTHYALSNTPRLLSAFKRQIKGWPWALAWCDCVRLRRLIKWLCSQ